MAASWRGLIFRPSALFFTYFCALQNRFGASDDSNISTLQTLRSIFFWQMAAAISLATCLIWPRASLPFLRLGVPKQTPGNTGYFLKVLNRNSPFKRSSDA